MCGPEDYKIALFSLALLPPSAVDFVAQCIVLGKVNQNFYRDRVVHHALCNIIVPHSVISEQLSVISFLFFMMNR